MLMQKKIDILDMGRGGGVYFIPEKPIVQRAVRVYLTLIVSILDE